MSAPVPCPSKHTVPQVPDAAFKCPKCGGSPNPKTDGNEFVIWEPAADANPDCILLHDADELGCNCEYGVSGKAFARAYAARQGLVPCSHCKGKGLVKGKASGR